jgi:capsular polysaccharide biosynthesis protein
VSMPGIDPATLRCESVLSPRAGVEAVGVGAFDGGALQAARVADVLYLPTAGLQIAPGGIVPLEAVQDPWCLDFEVKRRFQGKLDAFAAAFEVPELDGESCVLGNFYSRNFFHWISEELVKVVMLERSGFQGRYVLSPLPAFVHEFLALLGIPAARIVVADGPLRLRSAWYTTAITARRLHRFPGLFHALREALLREVTPATGHRRIWMDRRLGVNNAGRELINPDEVYPLLARHGFEVLDMAAFPVARQLALASGAEALSGPHGAGFIHATFLPPRSHVIECFSPLFINPGIFEISRLLRHRYQMVAYENCYDGYPHGDRLMVDVSQLELALLALD